MKGRPVGMWVAWINGYGRRRSTIETWTRLCWPKQEFGVRHHIEAATVATALGTFFWTMMTIFVQFVLLRTLVTFREHMDAFATQKTDANTPVSVSPMVFVKQKNWAGTFRRNQSQLNRSVQRRQCQYGKRCAEGLGYCNRQEGFIFKRLSDA